MISQAAIDEVEEIKTAIDWSWATIARRLDWSTAYLAGFRSLKQPIAPVQLQWLRDIRAAIEALPPPGPESFVMPQLPQDVKVMLLDDIATKLIDEYFALDGQDASADEIAGARYMVGRLAERCGVADQVKEGIRQRSQPVFPSAPTPAQMDSFLQRVKPTFVEPEAVEATSVADYGIGGLVAPRRSTVENPFAMRSQRVPMADDPE